ncbi:hypothetical protein D3C72_2532150 [compost metagenome]
MCRLIDVTSYKSHKHFYHNVNRSVIFQSVTNALECSIDERAILRMVVAIAKPTNHVGDVG